MVFAAPDIDMDVFSSAIATSVRSLARSPSSPQRTIARWRCQGELLAG